mmetsp:Transcript_10223/g.33749  ORF Transcript_10223/g.33749 Transcript_10223/m.33749 type:complete len:258 (+) Transcript_10223:768-1541(+)
MAQLSAVEEGLRRQLQVRRLRPAAAAAARPSSSELAPSSEPRAPAAAAAAAGARRRWRRLRGAGLRRRRALPAAAQLDLDDGVPLVVDDAQPTASPAPGGADENPRAEFPRPQVRDQVGGCLPARLHMPRAPRQPPSPAPDDGAPRPLLPAAVHRRRRRPDGLLGRRRGARKGRRQVRRPRRRRLPHGRGAPRHRHLLLGGLRLPRRGRRPLPHLELANRRRPTNSQPLLPKGGGGRRRTRFVVVGKPGRTKARGRR